MSSIDKIIKLLKMPLFFLLFCYLVLYASYNLRGSDYLFHIKAGEYIVKHKEIPRKDIFSFTKEGKNWVDHEWLYQVLAYWFYNSLGIQGLFLLKIAIFSLAFFILTAFILKADWAYGFPLIFYGLQLSFRRFTLRPDNFSFLFMIVFLMPFVFRKKRLLYLLPFIQILWVNIHGFFFLGPLTLIIYLLLEKIRNKDFDRNFYGQAKIIFILTLAACFLNPQPLAAIAYPVNTLKDIFAGRQTIYYEYISELERPLSNISKNSKFIYYLIFSGLCLTFYKNTNFFYLGLYIIFALFSLNSVRNMYFFVPVAIVIFVNRYPYIKEVTLKKILKEKGFIFLRFLFVLLSVFISVTLFQKVRNFPKLGQTHIGQDYKTDLKSMFLSQDLTVYPQGIIDFMRKQELPARMFNDFNLGAPLIFNFFPQRKVFIDGRADLYGPEFFDLYLKVLREDQKALDAVLEKYQIEGFILSYLRGNPPSLIKLIQQRDFKCVYFGTDGIIFVKEDFLKKNTSLREQLVNFQGLKMRKLDLLGDVKLKQPMIEGYFKKAYCLYLLDYYDESKNYLKEILRISPAYAEGHYLLAQIYYKQKDYEKSFIYCRQSLLFNRSLGAAQELLIKIYIKTGDSEEASKIASKLKINFDSLLKAANDE